MSDLPSDVSISNINGWEASARFAYPRALCCGMFDSTSVAAANTELNCSPASPSPTDGATMWSSHLGCLARFV